MPLLELVASCQVRSERAVTNGVKVVRKLCPISTVPARRARGVYFSCISNAILACNQMHERVTDVIEVINKLR